MHNSEHFLGCWLAAKFSAVLVAGQQSAIRIQKLESERGREELQRSKVGDVVVRLELMIDGVDPSELLDFASSNQ